ncbi:hypothetical protein MKW94_007032 [Papaver nudicaule]|uniref:Putative plant transposon protein domain-containing protein n=1 Tax=Papaver nudicaule TaxID=74823 RepID=A0AA41RXU8_PAPNU|nr:hypothetical protein [Papaver nudicaule]
MIKSLLHIRGSAPISPVLMFYSQIHNLCEEDQSFDTYIEGKIHQITPQVIASLLGFDRPLEPVSFPPTNEDELVVSKDEFRRAVYLPEHVTSYGRKPRTEIKVAHLKPIIAVLVRICQSNILPVLNHHSVTNLNLVYLSFLLLNGYQVDISYVIWHTMAHLDRFKTKSVPYGIIVGQLLSYLGHPFPADTPCTTVPGAFDVNFLCRNNLRYDPCDNNDRALPEPHSNYISPPPIPPSTDADDASEVPLALPNDPPREIGCVPDSIRSLKDTMDVILSHVVTRQDRLEQQLQEMIACIGREDDRRKQQCEELLQQKKMIEHIALQQDQLQKQQQDMISHHFQQQHEEFCQQHKLITDDIVTRQDHFEQQQQEIFERIARQDDCLESQHQEVIDRIAFQEDLLEQQNEKFMRLEKTIENNAQQQDHFQQQHEEFCQQHKLITDDIVTQQDHFKQQQQKIIDRIARQEDCLESQHQEVIDRIAFQEDLLEQQHERFMRQEKTTEHTAQQQNHLQQQHEEFSQHQKLIFDGIVTREDHFEQQQQGIIDRIARQDDRFEQQQQKIIDRIACEDDRRKQQYEEFLQQKKMIEHIAHQGDQLQQQVEEFGQLQKLINDRYVTQQDHFEQQQQEMSNRITSQQDWLELRLEEFKQQPKLIHHLVTQPDCCEQQNQEMIGSIARKHDYPAQCQDQHDALSMQHVQRAYRDQVNPLCQLCGDPGYVDLLIHCNLCQTSTMHSYCLDKIPTDSDDETIWTCEDCEQTAELETQQGVQVTSSKDVIEDI